MPYVNGKTMKEIQVTPQQDQAYQALKKAAERIGYNNYLDQKEKMQGFYIDLIK